MCFTYQMKSPVTGKVLIINNNNFLNGDVRNGSEDDLTALLTVFQDQLNFNVTVKTDQTGKGIEDEIIKFKNQELRQNDVDVLVVVIMSHGNSSVTSNTVIYGTDEVECPVDDIVAHFLGDSCPEMGGKPKIFIFQCCRGGMGGLSVESNIASVNNTYADARPEHIRQVQKEDPRLHGDVLIAYATIPGFTAFRDIEGGSWYIQIMCEVFREQADKQHVEEMLRIVDDRLSKRRETTCVDQVCSHEARGFKRCYLSPRNNIE